VIGVEDEDYAAISSVLAEHEWHPQFAPFAVQLLPHFEAWEAAKDHDAAWKRHRDQQTRREAE
jgi:hypothetical protein